MSVSMPGYPMDDGDQSAQQDGRATPSEPPPDDWNAQFTAIVSGISGSMRWEATGDDLDEGATDAAQQSAKQGGPARTDDYLRAPDTIWSNARPDTAEDRRIRRDLRRQEREQSLAAHLEAQAAKEAEYEADTEHFVPPAPPPWPRFRRRTLGALILIAAGLLMMIWPTLLPVSAELIFVLALLLILAGGAILVSGMRRHHGDGWDDGAEV